MRSTVTDPRLRPTTLPTESSSDIDFETDAVAIPVKLCNLPPFNAVASQVLALSADHDLDLSDFSKLIEGDPAFAADILFLANSSLFGFPSRMHSLRHAIALLGLKRIKALAATVAMRGFLNSRNSLIHDCWQHSVACALVCEEISASFKFSADHAYTAGLMHDIGRLGLLNSYPKEMASVLSGNYGDMQDVLRAEREALNVDHGRAGAWLITAWALPKEFSVVCEHHHDAPQADDSDVLQLVRTACQIAAALGFAGVNCHRLPCYAVVTSPLVRLGGKEVPPPEELSAIVTARLAAFKADPVL